MRPKASLWRALLSLGLLVLAGPPEATATSLPMASSRPVAATAPAAMAVAGAAELFQTGLRAALAGRFHEALAALRQARKLAPEDEVVSAASELLNRYISRRADWTAERDAELVVSIQRVRLSLLAQSHLDELVGAGIAEKLRQEVQEATSAYNRSGSGEVLEHATDTSAAEVKSNALNTLKEASAALVRAVTLLKGREGEYAETFRRVAAMLSNRLEAYREAWKTVGTKTVRDRYEASLQLTELEDDLTDALADIEALSAGKPWQVGLINAELILERIASGKESLKKEDWYRQLVTEVDAIGREAVEKAAWRDALSAYSGLHTLEPDNEDYANRAQTVRRHVRALSLYGQEPQESGAATLPAADQEQQGPVGEFEELRWKQFTDRVDKDMVQRVIGELHDNYVSAVDYRKLARGGLMSLKVLAETPQVAETFQGLSDEEQRQRFLAAIDKEMRSIEANDWVGYEALAYALNAVVRASERTVRIPTAVVAVEFADGFMDELDKFSSIIWPRDVSDFNKSMKGRFFGVGIQITKERGQPLKVVTPLLDTPAYRAGIKTGDLIVAVNGQHTEHIGVEKLVGMIMGPKGTKVVLRIKRPGFLEPKDFQIERDEIHIRTVKGWRRRVGGPWDYMLDPDAGIAYLRIEQFTQDTHKDVVEALMEMRAAAGGSLSLVLDLRVNPGGLLGAAYKVADEFLRTGTIVSTRGRGPGTEHTARHDGQFLDGDMVVLVNGASASAAEIVSGALKDLGRAVIVGERTYGKGSVQKVIEIPRHPALLKLTTAYYYLPKGRLLHKKNHEKDWGVDPDVVVGSTPKQLQRWRVVRRKTDVIRDIDAEEARQDDIRQYDADMQLQTALLLLKLKRLQQDWLQAAAG